MLRLWLAAMCAVVLVAPAPIRGFAIEQIATVPGARELAFSPDGSLFVGTTGADVYVVGNAEGNPQPASIFVSPQDDPAAGVAFANGALFVGTQHAVWRVGYRNGMRHAQGVPVAIARVRTGDAPAGSDGDVHTTTSLAADATHLYASVGSSCNACVETDPTRATVGEISRGSYAVIAKRIRNAIALAIDGQGELWVSDAGQDELPPPHPYEFFDDLGKRAKPADYGWPDCYENGRRRQGLNAECSHVAVPEVIFPAYETPIGAAFYPAHERGRHAFPPRYAGGAFVTLHGSWHGPRQGLPGYLPPRVVYVPMRDGRPAREANWGDASTQWLPFVAGYQEGQGNARSGRPTGVAVGPEGSLFVGDDEQGAVYRIRPR